MPEKGTTPNPFLVLGFSRGLVAKLTGLPPQPDAIRKVAEAMKVHLLRAHHPDRHIGGTAQSQVISEAFELVKRPGPERNQFIAEFLEREEADAGLRTQLSKIKGELASLRQSLDAETARRRNAEATKEVREEELTKALHDIYWDTIFEKFTRPSLKPIVPSDAISLLRPPKLFIVEMERDQRGWLLLCREREIVRQLDFSDSKRFGKAFARDNLLKRINLTNPSHKKGNPIILGSMTEEELDGFNREVYMVDLVEILEGIRFYMIPGGQLISARLHSAPQGKVGVTSYSPVISRIEVLEP